jgi:EF-P beta-lysylation protein EpmB
MSLPVEITTDAFNFSASTDVTEQQWKKELTNATTSAASLLERLGLEHHRGIIDLHPGFRCLVTEAYINKMEAGNIDDPLLRQVLPLVEETDTQLQKAGVIDPVGDLEAQVSRGLIHKYHGRALLITTGACAIHCRYCFRRSYPYQQSSCASSALQDALHYLSEHSEIEEIILSGGDPLMLDNARLSNLVSALEGIRHVHTIRIHTRLPIVLPSRINAGLLDLLKYSRFHTVMVIHANHANELDDAVSTGLQQLHDTGIMLLNQSVLLKGVNDNAEALVALSRRLFQCRTLPYYLHLLDPVTGAMHFAVSQQTAIDLKRQLEAQLPGYLVPRLVCEIAGSQAKTAIFRI